MSNQNPVQIDLANHADIPALSQLIDSLFALESEYKINQDAQQRGLTLLLSSGSRARLWCARAGSRVVGMVSVQLVASTAEGAWSGWMEDLIVQEDYRSQGTGKALVDAAWNWAKSQGATRMQALVDQDNHAAMKFYNKLNFTRGCMFNITLHQPA